MKIEHFNSKQFSFCEALARDKLAIIELLDVIREEIENTSANTGTQTMTTMGNFVRFESVIILSRHGDVNTIV